jgi:hypothetical protein
MQAFRCGVEPDISGSKLFVQLFLRARHDILQHSAPAHFVYKSIRSHVSVNFGLQKSAENLNNPLKKRNTAA